MDRCRCEEYAEAAKKVRFYTVGTIHPDIIANYNRTGFKVVWKKNGVSLCDFKFSKPYALKIYDPKDLPENQLSKDARKVEQMWCPFMTPYVIRDD